MDDVPNGMKMIHVGLGVVVDEFGPMPVCGHTIDGNQNGRTAVPEQTELLQKHLPNLKLTMISDLDLDQNPTGPNRRFEPINRVRNIGLNDSGQAARGTNDSSGARHSLADAAGWWWSTPSVAGQKLRFSSTNSAAQW